jgi:hypothetical protein
MMTMSSSEGVLVLDPAYKALMDANVGLVKMHSVEPFKPKPRPAHAKRPIVWKLKIYDHREPWPYYEPKGDDYRPRSTKHGRRAYRLKWPKNARFVEYCMVNGMHTFYREVPTPSWLRAMREGDAGHIDMGIQPVPLRELRPPVMRFIDGKWR